MKKLAMIILGMSLCIVCSGCDKSPSIDEDTTIEVTESNTNRFVETGKIYSICGGKWVEVVDTETNNLYLCMYSDFTYGNVGKGFAGLSPEYDEDGNIAKYEIK